MRRRRPTRLGRSIRPLTWPCCVRFAIKRAAWQKWLRPEDGDDCVRLSGAVLVLRPTTGNARRRAMGASSITLTRTREADASQSTAKEELMVMEGLVDGPRADSYRARWDPLRVDARSN